MSRPRGSGRIYQQKQSTIWWIQFYRNGKMYRESTGTSDKRKATKILGRRLAEVSTGTFVGPDVERVRIAELAEDFLRDYRINGKASLDDAEARWRLHLEPIFGQVKPSAVTSDLLDRYDATLSRLELRRPIRHNRYARIALELHRGADHGRNLWARCPSCAQIGRDRTGDNLAIQIKNPRFYRCWAGCTKEEIRAALGQSIRRHQAV